jgi:hypothetical protein
MPSWLFEGSPTVYFLLACAAVLCAVAWWRTRKRKYLIGAAVAGGLLLGVYALDRLVESDGEQIERKLHEMAAGVTARDYDRVFQHVSDSFLVGAVNKSGFRRYTDVHARQFNVAGMSIWDVTPTNVSRERRRADVEFRFRVRTNLTDGREFFLARTVFALDPDGQWRLQSFQIFNPVVDTNQPMHIHGWGG